MTGQVSLTCCVVVTATLCCCYRPLPLLITVPLLQSPLYASYSSGISKVSGRRYCLCCGFHTLFLWVQTASVLLLTAVKAAGIAVSAVLETLEFGTMTGCRRRS